MELVDGETLADTIRRGPVPADRVAEVGARLADALAYVHAQGLVHRDVKPANVLLGKDGRVRLTDFGIARLVDAAKVTATGLTVGTASYLSPEQVTSDPVGPPTDIYALGLVLLECLKGEREYPGSAVEVALARLNRQPVIPPLPGGWGGLLAAMTDRDPARRPTAKQVASDLHAVATGGQATTVLAAAPRPPAADRTQVMDRTRMMTTAQPAAAPPVRVQAPPPRRSPWPVVALVVAVAALLLGALFVSQQGTTSVPDPVTVDQSVPDKLRQDLVKLQNEVRR
jgi:serine/threonine protein kinase